jgi:hypothetical protein
MAILHKNKGGYVLNRTKFHDALSEEFEDWITVLRGDDAGLHANMCKRMNDIIARHYSK